MTRTRNGSITGTYDFDADVDAPTFARVLREIAQDVHMLYDSVTGQNSPGSAPAIQVIDHSGAAGAGALLGMTSWQQPVWVRPFMSEGDLATYAINGGSVILLAKPHFVCDGENVLVVEVDADEDAEDLYCEVYSAAGALIQSSRMSWASGAVSSESGEPRGNGTWRAIFQFTSTGVQTYVVVRRIYEAGRNWCALQAWRGFSGRVGGPAQAAFPANGNNLPVTTGGTGIGAWELLHDEMFTADYALAGHLPNRLNRMLNGLWEYVTGAPVPGNASVQNANFKDHRRAAYATEPLIQLPWFGEGLGAYGWNGDVGGGEAWALVDTADPPTDGMVSWFAPYPVDVAETTVHRCSVFCDNFDYSTMQLKCTVLATADMLSDAFKYTPTAWEARVYNSAAGTPGSGWVAFTQIGTLPLLAATIYVTPPSPGAHNPFELRTRRPTGTYTFGELAILGWDFFFEP